METLCVERLNRSTPLETGADVELVPGTMKDSSTDLRLDPENSLLYMPFAKEGVFGTYFSPEIKSNYYKILHRLKLDDNPIVLKLKH